MARSTHMYKDVCLSMFLSLNSVFKVSEYFSKIRKPNDDKQKNLNRSMSFSQRREARNQLSFLVALFVR